MYRVSFGLHQKIWKATSEGEITLLHPSYISLKIDLNLLSSIICIGHLIFLGASGLPDAPSLAVGLLVVTCIHGI